MKIKKVDAKEAINIIESKEPRYFFHKDCMYYKQCSEEVICEGKHKYVKFTCPMLKHSQKYYPDDIHKIKWECAKFEPSQINLFS